MNTPPQDICASLQHEFTETSFKRLGQLQKRTGSTLLVLTGGCALNICLVSRLEESSLFQRGVMVPPCCSDTGLAVGGAAFVELLKGQRTQRTQLISKHPPYLVNVGLPSAVNDAPIDADAAHKCAAKLTRLLAGHKIIGICQGAAEVGPRALGNRSILALPTAALRDQVSLVMKKREWYRPVAPVMLLQNALQVTGRTTMPVTSRYMLSQFVVLPKYRSRMEGAVHHDGTARIQVFGVHDKSH
jgi:carbamoyltransferase